MGGGLALRWAAANSQRVQAVLTFGAPLYRDRAEADKHVHGMGRMQALLSGDGTLPRLLCAWMCRHRSLASWVAVAYRPDLPVAVARSGVKHTWATYSGAMDGPVRSDGWCKALDHLDRAHIPVSLVAGARDPVPVAGRAEKLADRHPNISVVVHPDGDHGLPMTDPTWCRALIGRAVDAGRILSRQ